MLNENIKNLRKAKGISQEELAIKLNAVRQTVSKWENGLSVPDSSMLISICCLIILVFIVFATMQSSLYWDYTDPETAVAGTILHGFEWIFVRLAPFMLIASVIGIAISYRKK